VLQHVAALERLDEQKAERRGPLLDGLGGQLSFGKQVSLILADMLGAELRGRAVEVLGEVAHRKQVHLCGFLGVVATLEFLQHSLS
jgi:hypothetical protein